MSGLSGDADAFDRWLTVGYRAGWCGPAVCAVHDGVPTTEAEDQAYDDGGDPCAHVLRLYETAQTKCDVETNHPPSVWRATNAGMIN